MRWAVLSWLVLTCAAASAAGSLQPVRPDEPAAVIRAVFAQGRTWLLTDDGRLSSVAQGERSRRIETVPEPVHELCVLQGGPLIVTGPRESPERLSMRRLDGAAWTIEAMVSIDHEALVALACTPDGATLVTTMHLFELVGRQGLRKLRNRLDLANGVVSAVHATRDAVFVGVNRGEWGGGLYRIDRGTGQVAPVAKAGGESVNAIVDDPWKPGCLVVAQGLMHFMPDGRLLEVCGDAVDTLYTAKIPLKDAKGGTFMADEAFFGLAVDQGGVLAVADSGMYRLDALRHASVVALPAFQDLDGISLSFELPGQILVLTSVNQRHSISGMTPMLVQR